MTDLRDQLPAFEAAARRLLTRRTTSRRPGLALVHARPATCHPDRPVHARGLCQSDYEMAYRRGTHLEHPARHTIRSRADFVADYTHLRSFGWDKRRIAEALGMTLPAVRRAYQRAVDAGDLTPDRRAA